MESHFTGAGPRTGKWEDQYPYRTWEINMPDNSRPREWPDDLVGIMDFEYDRIVEACQIH